MYKVIPPGLNYADIKPEAIENNIRIVKFTPIATIYQAQANDIVRFHLQGNGFFDPYSAYIRIVVEVDDIPDPTEAAPFYGKFLDRSAHSLFSRLVIRSQGTELERIEQYDVMAAMINDMIYSQEQRLLHHYEGFAHRQVVQNTLHHIEDESTGCIKYLPYLMPGASYNVYSHCGDFGVFKMNYNRQEDSYIDFYYLEGNLDKADATFNDELNATLGAIRYGINNLVDRTATSFYTGGYYPSQALGVYNYGYTFRLDDLQDFDTRDGYKGSLSSLPNINTSYGIMSVTSEGSGLNIQNVQYTLSSPTYLVFTIPIYSGIVGVLMPEKKFLPMSLLPLELEFTMNPHAFYPVGSLVNNRGYTVKKFEIWTHTLFFEQELHRSLEAVVAESGIFLHYNSMYLAPINTYNGAAGTISNYNQLGVFLKSINAVHWTFLYSAYETVNGPRKLHFVCHNTSYMQLRNGMELTPSEPILAKTGHNTFGYDVQTNEHCQFLIETYKAWNKMHDPLSDGAITAFNYNLDTLITKPLTLNELIKYQLELGRCYYGISLEGEELGQAKTIITGKKSTMPFDLNLQARKSQAQVSYMMCFLRADFIIYVRPDLVVTRLGL